ncbi:MAG TPA: CBS domain-containing protein [Candidatus Omnitrophota bacterium]|nr:CBS domain-containing protein [Candidatus Omnitrophota bacterium]HPD85548.1 CBS domain-containing protein [Candidatus Omnitrophota bacterium]HRZ04412.1 CBS domain-containing protein [Candidatus Omnitrophota bacterium]
MLKQTGFAISITSGVVVAGENDTVFDVANLMKKHNIGAVVILKKERITGIVSERDIVKRVVCGELPARKTKVRSIMTKKVVTADICQGLNKIHEIMCMSPFRHLPIVKDGKLIGIVSSRNLVAALSPKPE